MSDLASESTVAALAHAMARDGGFRPLQFGQPRSAPLAPVAEAAAEPADDPFSRGLGEGQRLAEAAFAVERQQLLAMVAAAEALQDEPSEELAQLIAETVERLVRQIVEAAPIEADWLRTQAETAAALVAEADKARTLWVNPADAVLLIDAPIALPIESDPSMARGTVRVETSAGWIEHGRAVYLDELRAALGSQGAAA
ncbi:FliH/SctL family protein [Sphingopyxis terrae subsp. ummariensis]